MDIWMDISIIRVGSCMHAAVCLCRTTTAGVYFDTVAISVRTNSVGLNRDG